MARVELDTTLYRRSGEPAAGATARVRQRGTATDLPVYSAATGGVALAQPLTADAEGRLGGWIDSEAYLEQRVDIVHTIDGVTTTQQIEYPSAAPVWTAVTFTAAAPAWTNYGGAFATAAYTKTSEGLVLLRGLVAGGTIGAVVFALPGGYRPPVTRRFPILTNSAWGRVEVNANGNVTIPNGSSTWASLDGIMFPTA